MTPQRSVPATPVAPRTASGKALLRDGMWENEKVSKPLLGALRNYIKNIEQEAAADGLDAPDRHRYRGSGGKCKDCGRVYSNPVHRQSKAALHTPLPRALTSITPEEMVDALLAVRLGVEGSDSDDQRRSTRYYAERLLARLAAQEQPK